MTRLETLLSLLSVNLLLQKIIIHTDYLFTVINAVAQFC